MDKDPNGSAVHNTSYSRESESDKSFVGKVKSIISTPLSKWFGKQDDNRPVVRRRDEDFEDDVDISEIQPPLKRVKLPDDGGTKYNNEHFNESCISATNSVSNHIFHKIPEPVAGPSGLKNHKLLNSATTISANSARSTFSTNELLNGHSDSEESTSGYSSVARIGSKEQVCGSQESSKQTSPSTTSPSNSRSLFNKSSVRPNRSLFADRSLSPNMNTSMSSRRPNFNASTFGSPNFVDKTISTKRIINSPFYNGKTIYGGASAYGRRLGRSSQDLKTSLRTSVQIKPVNKTAENGNLVLGKTARRILDTIEQYSSPISDAKKIPIVPRKLRQEGLLTKYTGANPYVLRENKVPSNKELQVPTVSDLLKMKTRLQDSTETVRQIATSSKSDLNTEYYKIHTKEDEKDKHTAKIKTKITSTRPKPQINELVNEVNLTPVSLPITSLPKFDFVIPPPLSTKSISGSPTQTMKTTQQTSSFKSPNPHVSPKTQTEIHVQKEKRTTTSASVEYKFSDPLVVAENIKSIIAINNFKFSEPPTCTINKSDSSKSVTLNFKMPENKIPNLLPNKKPTEEPVKTAPILKSGSVMDILGKKDKTEKDSVLEKFKPAQGTWECSICMIRNQPDKTRCVACESPKVTPATKKVENKNTLSSQFKQPSDKWECSSCMVYNNSSETKCVCCTTPKPNSLLESKPLKSVIPSGFGDAFKPSTDTWECGTCMIRNKTELTKCAACETPNPKAIPTGHQVTFSNKVEPTNGITKQSDFGSAFKVKSDEWECSTCMIRNKSSNSKCQCCETPNPKFTPSSSPPKGIAGDKKPISSFNFGIDKAAATSFSFGIPMTASVSLPTTSTTTTAIFGEITKPPANAPASFSFGIPPPTQEKLKAAETPTSSSEPINKDTTTAKPEAAKLETSTADTNKPMFNFKTAPTNGDTNTTPFGNKPDTTPKVTPATTSAGMFAFGSKPAAVAAPLVTATQPSQSEPAKPLFKFDSSTEKSSFPATNSSTTSLKNGFGSTSTFGTPTTSTGTKSTEVKPFTFGSGASKDATVPASKAPMFSFGQSASSVATTMVSKTPGFSFGSTSTPSFSFNAGKTETPSFNAAPTNNVFGSTTNPASQNGTFNFGNVSSSTNNQKAGFSFGAAANPTGSASQSGFNFGAPAATFASAPVAGGFNFSGAVAGFDANAKPTFNFTDGSVTAFSAQPPTDGGVAAPRKIKRAVRRTQR